LKKKNDIEIRKPKIRIFDVNMTSIDNMVWCAAVREKQTLIWYKGYLMCIDDQKYEREDDTLYISCICLAKMPKYEKIIEKPGMAPINVIKIPVVKASDLEKDIIEEILKKKKLYRIE